MEEMDTDIQKVVQSYFDCDWEQFEDDARIQEIIQEMKSLADMYLKTKTSKAGDTMTASIAMEAELKRLKGNLLHRITQLKIESEKNPTANPDQEIEVHENEATVEEVSPDQEQTVTQHNSSSKLPLILSAFALLSGMGAFYWALEMSASKSDLENIRQTTVDSVMKDVNATVDGSKADIEGMKAEIQLLKQEVEAAKLEVAVAKQDATDKILAQKNEFDLRLAALQSSVRKPQPAPPVAKPVGNKKPAVKPAAPVAKPKPRR
jgi:hypothetical protein